MAVFIAFAIPVTDLGVPSGALADDDRNGGVGFNVVDVGGAAPVTAADVGGEWRLRGGFATETFHGVDQSRLFAADESAGAEFDVDVEIESRAHDVLAEEAELTSLVDGQLQTGNRERVFRADIDETVLGADGIATDGHGFDDGAGVAFHDGTIHERAGVAFVSVANDVLFFSLNASGDLPLHAGGESRAATAADTGVQDFLDDVGGLHVEEALGEGLVAFRRDVFGDVFRIEEAAVAEGDAFLLGVERHLGVVMDAFLDHGFDVEEAFDQLVVDDVLFDDVLRVFGLDLDVEDVVRHDLDDRALGAETEATGLDDIHVVFKTSGLDFGTEVGDDVLTVGDQAAGIAADEDVFLLGIRLGTREAKRESAFGGIIHGHQVGLACNLFHALASLALISSTTVRAMAGVTLP